MNKKLTLAFLIISFLVVGGTCGEIFREELFKLGGTTPPPKELGKSLDAPTEDDGY